MLASGPHGLHAGAPSHLPGLALALVPSYRLPLSILPTWFRVVATSVIENATSAHLGNHRPRGLNQSVQVPPRSPVMPWRAPSRNRCSCIASSAPCIHPPHGACMKRGYRLLLTQIHACNGRLGEGATVAFGQRQGSWEMSSDPGLPGVLRFRLCVCVCLYVACVMQVIMPAGQVLSDTPAARVSAFH